MIIFQDKVNINTDPTIPEINKITAQNINNLKSGVNANETEIINIKNTKIFSTNEELTGETWIDGRPIYRKVITTTVNANSSAVIDLSSLNKYEGWIDQGNTFTHYDGTSSSSAAVFYANSSDYGLCYLNSVGNLSIVNQNSRARTFFITLKYTKTTDVAS